MASTTSRSPRRAVRASTLWEKPTFSGACSASQRSCSARACLGLKWKSANSPSSAAVDAADHADAVPVVARRPGGVLGVIHVHLGAFVERRRLAQGVGQIGAAVAQTGVRGSSLPGSRPPSGPRGSALRASRKIPGAFPSSLLAFASSFAPAVKEKGPPRASCGSRRAPAGYPSLGTGSRGCLQIVVSADGDCPSLNRRSGFFRSLYFSIRSTLRRMCWIVPSWMLHSTPAVPKKPRLSDCVSNSTIAS